MRSVSRKALEESRDTQDTRACAVRATAAAVVVVIAYGEDLEGAFNERVDEGTGFFWFSSFFVSSEQQQTNDDGRWSESWSEAERRLTGVKR